MRVTVSFRVTQCDSVTVTGLTKILKVDSDLMHPPRERSAEHHAGGPVEAHPLELRPALLAVAGDLADPDLVADHLHWLGTLSEAPVKPYQ